jgi:hypothetical protein
MSIGRKDDLGYHYQRSALIQSALCIEERGNFQFIDHFTISDSLEFDYQKTSYFDPGGG